MLMVCLSIPPYSSANYLHFDNQIKEATNIWEHTHMNCVPDRHSNYDNIGKDFIFLTVWPIHPHTICPPLDLQSSCNEQWSALLACGKVNVRITTKGVENILN